VSTPGARGLLVLASVAVAFAAADTYVVVLALPEMMSGAGLAIDELSRAAPIVSGFLLGYVAILPLIGRVADLRGRVPVLVGSLVVFALGSLITAAAYDLPSMVTGRFLQGVGGGGLVPATLALVADLYPPQRRGLPLGLVGAVQELGSVLGPVYGAVVLAFADWRAIFWVNLAVGAGLAVAVRRRHRAVERPPADRPGGLLGALCLAAVTLVMLQPPALATDVTLGLGFVPLVGESRWLSPLGLAAIVLGAGFWVRCATARHPVVDVRRWRALARRTDLAGAALLALCLAGIIVAFASADPQVQALSAAGGWLLAGSALAAVGFWWRTRTAPSPLVPAGAFAAMPARGAVAVSFFVGAALIAALVDVPVFARVTVYPDSQLAAALVLLRLLVGLPAGALLGGYLTRRVSAGPVAAVGMLLAAVGFGWMATWGAQSLAQPLATVPLVGTGVGFGLALAPVNAALLASTRAAEHGVASALLVVARMVGMLVGISALTTLGLRRYYAVQADLPGPAQVCASGTRCPEYTALLREAGLAQLHTVFIGAAGCALVAAVLALLTFRGAPTRSVSPAEALRSIG
jgi:MFS family permease